MTSVKGLLKGLRYIAQIFDQPKEPEMQIGLPTDVKHVAHIGWDGPSAVDPSWMSGFKCVPEIAKRPSNSIKESKNPAKYLESDKKPQSTTDKPKHKSRSKSSTGGGSVVDSPTKRRSDGSKQSRYSVDSPRGLNKSSLGDDQSTCSDPAGVPKSSRRKKSKGSEGPSKALKSKGGNSLADTDTGQRMKTTEVKLSTVVETNEEDRG
ncbi:hypothetical protein KPL71_027155 [Citrus sinensis]|uniref:Uncharacterized protein n=2 Tax=Citrus sinensis TaxID=2711 RepID=A0ACB8I681_CITSI|nr:hypothetical protein KPL71_027155 [Citrus sinensis]